MASAATEPVLIVDTGVLVATADITDPHHTACLDLLADEPEPLVTTAMVIAETAYLLDRDLGPQAAARFYDSITSGQMSVEALTIEDWQRVHDLVVQYADLRLGGTDAGLIALAERHHTQRIATLTVTPGTSGPSVPPTPPGLRCCPPSFPSCHGGRGAAAPPTDARVSTIATRQ